MVLLGDLGGLLGSLLVFATGFHLLIVGDSMPMQLLRHYFLVEDSDLEDSHPLSQVKNKQQVADISI